MMVETKHLYILMFTRCIKEYNPILAPISQKIIFSLLSLLKLSIHSIVSGSFERIVSTRHLIIEFGVKISFFSLIFF